MEFPRGSTRQRELGAYRMAPTCLNRVGVYRLILNRSNATIFRAVTPSERNLAERIDKDYPRGERWAPVEILFYRATLGVVLFCFISFRLIGRIYKVSENQSLKE